MQLSMTVNVWSLGVKELLATSPVNTMKLWFSPVLPYQATGNEPAASSFGGASETVITGAFEP